jgi:hypothetical protein
MKRVVSLWIQSKIMSEYVLSVIYNMFEGSDLFKKASNNAQYEAANDPRFSQVTANESSHNGYVALL